MEPLSGRGRSWNGGAFACVVVLCGGLLALSAAPAAAKKEHKKADLGPVVTRSATATSSGAGQSITAIASCPKGKRAVGGGFTTTNTGGDLLVVWKSARSGQSSWKVSADSNSPTPNTLKTLVYCRQVTKPISDVAVTATTTPVRSRTATAKASCPNKRTLIGGGFESTHGATFGEVATPYVSRAGGGGWTYSAMNDSPAAQTITSHAYCAKGLEGPKQVARAASRKVGAGATLSVLTPGCTGHKRISAGGFSQTRPTIPGPIPFVLESRINGTGWLARSINLGGAASMFVTAQGFCL